ncbi:MAG: hypothetical protein L0229_14250 [Blastocatellia bacterium]|nr:hypothetical protein [Blastocatellia bacterium]
MILRQRKTNGQKRAEMRLHSIAGLLRGRHFSGSFDVAGASYKFAYAPSRAEIVEGKLQLEGRLTITDPQGRPRVRAPVKAKLLSMQGGIGSAPPRPPVAGARRPDEAAGRSDGLPIIESTGPLAFCGVMYFHFEPVNGPALGVAADLSRVQLNARLAPTEPTGRELHGLYSAIVDALYGEQVDRRAADALIGELNKTLTAG